MKHQPVDALLASGQASPTTTPKLTRDGKLDIIIAALKSHGKKTFGLMHGVEHMPIGELRAQPIEGTILEPIALALGLQATTAGQVMNAVPFTRGDIHCFGCDCVDGEPVVAGELASLMILGRKQRMR